MNERNSVKQKREFDWNPQNSSDYIITKEVFSSYTGQEYRIIPRFLSICNVYVLIHS